MNPGVSRASRVSKIGHHKNSKKLQTLLSGMINVYQRMAFCSAGKEMRDLIFERRIDALSRTNITIRLHSADTYMTSFHLSLEIDFVLDDKYRKRKVFFVLRRICCWNWRVIIFI